MVNAIHAIEERYLADISFSNGRIVIEIMRSQQLMMSNPDTPELSPIEGVKITDNGIGFNERNMQSFLESDSTYKAELGGKGVGRFSWLKSFGSVQISSTFKDTYTFLKRDFVFSLRNPYIDDTLVECEEAGNYSTSATLDSYLTEYKSEAPKQIGIIATRIIQHFGKWNKSHGYSFN